LAVKGFLEYVDPLRVVGWAYDDAMPDRQIEIALTCRGAALANGIANVYRHDLEQAKVGQGDHGFVFNLETPLPAQDLPAVTAAAIVAPAAPSILRRWVPAEPAMPAALPPVVFEGMVRDAAHRPVFILGSARSGTSAVTQALLAATRYQGQEEGHFLDVLAPLRVHLHSFYKSKGDEYAGGRNTMLAHIPEKFMQDALAHGIICAMRQIFPGGLWLDKTPSDNMIHLAPLFREIWPQARFIFMKRRGIENILSRQRKFPYDFARNCQEWKQAMEAWLAVREALKGVALELDQHFVATSPAAASAAMATLLNLNPTETERLGIALGTVRPQQTNLAFSKVSSMDETGWNDSDKKIFMDMCGEMMARYRYSLGGGYFAAGAAAPEAIFC